MGTPSSYLLSFLTPTQANSLLQFLTTNYEYLAGDTSRDRLKSALVKRPSKVFPLKPPVYLYLEQSILAEGTDVRVLYAPSDSGKSSSCAYLKAMPPPGVDIILVPEAVLNKTGMSLEAAMTAMFYDDWFNEFLALAHTYTSSKRLVLLVDGFDKRTDENVAAVDGLMRALARVDTIVNVKVIILSSKEEVASELATLNSGKKIMPAVDTCRITVEERTRPEDLVGQWQSMAWRKLDLMMFLKGTSLHESPLKAEAQSAWKTIKDDQAAQTHPVALQDVPVMWLDGVDGHDRATFPSDVKAALIRMKSRRSEFVSSV